MTDGVLRLRPFDPQAVEVVLCDADGNLFGSEEPAFDASTEVTNRLLAALGSDRTFTPHVLRRRSMGRTFRATAQDLAAEAGATLEPGELERWVAEERAAVIAHLSSVLRPDPAVQGPLRALAGAFDLAVVSSSALERLAACFTATGLDNLLPADVRFSAEDSLPVPTSKPDPAIYTFAGEQLSVTGAAGLAVEDAAAGAQSAVAAGFPTVGNLQFVAPAEREERIEALRDAGVVAIVPSWQHLTELLGRETAAEALEAAGRAS
ncbi:MAG TPA: HAD family hydrolase [Baekduia sp.]|nr:HAD family hydrolase [Baekduia sp.]